MAKMQRVVVPTVLEQLLTGTPITYSPWTAETVRKDLPEVQVNLNGRVMACMVCGRLNEFATVFIHGYATQWQFSWSAIARSLNTGKPLVAGN
jgi:hypothetical protein